MILRRWFSRTRADQVSAAWLADQQRQSLKVEYHGPAIRWPITRPAQQNGVWNRFALARAVRKSA